MTTRRSHALLSSLWHFIVRHVPNRNSKLAKSKRGDRREYNRQRALSRCELLTLYYMPSLFGLCILDAIQCTVDLMFRQKELRIQIYIYIFHEYSQASCNCDSSYFIQKSSFSLSFIYFTPDFMQEYFYYSIIKLSDHIFHIYTYKDNLSIHSLQSDNWVYMYVFIYMYFDLFFILIILPIYNLLSWVKFYCKLLDNSIWMLCHWHKMSNE